MFDNIPQGDKWELIDNDENSTYYGDKLNFDFSYIESKKIKQVVKGYVWRNYREARKSLRYLYDGLSKFKYFNKFAVQNNIFSLKN